MPNQAQFPPTLGFAFVDDQIIEIGNIYDAEVKTIRYDASQRNILEKTALNTISNIPFSNNKETKLFLS